jgi:predicted peroxiredoxin
MNGTTDMMITLTTGKQDRGTRATLALSWGCAALAMGQQVSLFLTMDGTAWASKESGKEVSVAGFDPLEDYFEQFIELGGEMLVCAPCTEYYCSVESNQIDSVLRPSAELTGLATIVSKIGDGTKLITF